MTVERASRLLNALYLCGALMVTRSHPAARHAPAGWRGLFGKAQIERCERDRARASLTPAVFGR